MKTYRIWTRPDATVNFYKFPDELMAYIASTYDSTGKRISKTVTYSDDMLTCTVDSVWSNTAAFAEFLADSHIQNSAKLTTEYNTTNKIIESYGSR